MESALTNAYTHLDENLSYLNYSKEKSVSQKCHFFTKWHFEKFINRMKNRMEIKCMYKTKIL